MRVVLQKIRRIFFGTYARGYSTVYLLAICTGAFMLKLPFSIQSGVTFSWIDALFTSASALSVTGLSSVVIKD
ncbi:MAG: TrkH family potassium uptake protein, partial [Acholeplasmatales bacterium]